MYDKISGMTGTADTEAPEFLKIYGLDVVVIPTNRPVIREDHPDLVFYNEQFKLQAICQEIARVHKTGQPILVGTISIEKSELLSSLLKRMGIRHEVLNAKNHAREALIIENAGSKGAVTIATNMAGRGTDIKLGGSLEGRIRSQVGSEATREEYQAALEKIAPLWKKDYEEVKELGGLYVLGTERHESRRIDNQLRGRSGRQGDPGTSRFYVSLDDPLMRLFASDNVRIILGKIGMQSGEPIEHRMLSNAIEKAQKRVEDRNFEIRKHLLDYDDVLNEQRNFLYRERDAILASDDLVERVRELTRQLIEEEVSRVFAQTKDQKEQAKLLDKVTRTLMLASDPFEGSFTKDAITAHLIESADKEIDEKLKITGNAPLNEFLRFNYLRQIDIRWQNHLVALEDLRDAVSLRSYAQKNPLVEYKVEGFEIFTQMLDAIGLFVVQTLQRVKITPQREQYRRTPAQHKVVESHSQQLAFAHEGPEPAKENAVTTIRREGAKVGRNDPCPCGSGKKYKHCHGA